MAVRPIVKAIISTGLLAGSLDASAASIQYWITTGKSPVRVFWYIASAVFGKEAYLNDPVVMAVTGLLFHYLIAMIFTLFLFLLYKRIIQLVRNAYLLAIFYGLFVWTVMNLLVVPTSRIAKSPVKFPQSFIQMGILIICIGLPVCVFANRFYTIKPKPVPVQ